MAIRRPDNTTALLNKANALAPTNLSGTLIAAEIAAIPPSPPHRTPAAPPEQLWSRLAGHAEIQPFPPIDANPTAAPTKQPQAAQWGRPIEVLHPRTQLDERRDRQSGPRSLELPPDLQIRDPAELPRHPRRQRPLSGSHAGQAGEATLPNAPPDQELAHSRRRIESADSAPDNPPEQPDLAELAATADEHRSLSNLPLAEAILHSPLLLGTRRIAANLTPYNTTLTPSGRDALQIAGTRTRHYPRALIGLRGKANQEGPTSYRAPRIGRLPTNRIPPPDSPAEANLLALAGPDHEPHQTLTQPPSSPPTARKQRTPPHIDHRSHPSPAQLETNTAKPQYARRRNHDRIDPAQRNYIELLPALAPQGEYHPAVPPNLQFPKQANSPARAPIYPPESKSATSTTATGLDQSDPPWTDPRAPAYHAKLEAATRPAPESETPYKAPARAKTNLPHKTPHQRRYPHHSGQTTTRA